MNQVDVTVENHGTIFLFFPQTEAGKDWITENLADDAMWLGDGLVVEHGYAHDLAEGMIVDGLSLQ